MTEAMLWTWLINVIALAAIGIHAAYRICPAKCFAFSKVLSDTKMLG
jgi:hypothetical protein